MYPSPAPKSLHLGLLLAALGFVIPSAWAAPLVGAVEFNANPGDFTAVSTNNPGAPWAHDAGRGSWRASDTPDCGTPFRSSRLNSPILTVPAAGTVTLSFSHRYSFEVDSTRWDGGQLRISVNQGPYVEVPLASFSANGYNNTVGGASVPSCELAGQQAFTAQSAGYDLEEYIISTATLGPFNANDTISIQFLGAWDDCSQGLVPNWEIDRVEFSPPLEDRRTPPTFTVASLPADATVVEGSSHTLRAAPAGQTSLQWYKDSVAIPGANNTNYTIVRMTMADAGHYFLQAANAIGSSTSRVATVSFQPDTTPPAFLSARCTGGNPDDFTVRLSEPLEMDNGQGYAVTDSFLWEIQTVTGPGANPGLPINILYTNGDTVIYMTAQGGTLDFSVNTYRLVNVQLLIDTSMAHNVLPADSSVPLICPKGIVVEASGAGPYTFDSPPSVKEFATITWAGAANGTTDTPAVVGARAQLLDASAINVALAAAAGSPPAAAAASQWASVGLNLITRPTGVGGCIILARLENDSGVARTSVDISYDLLGQSPVVEEVPGHLVYYSLSGAPSQWQLIPGISTNRVSGLKKASLNLNATPWPVGSLLYLLWVDDNGSGSPDDANQIDNFTVSFANPALAIRYSSPNVIITWPAGSGVLQSKPTLTAPTWTDVPGAGSSGSATISATDAHQFFTLRAP